MSIFTGQNKTMNFHSLYSHHYSFCYHYQYIVNLHIISQKRYKNTYAPKKYEKPAVRSNFVQYVATVTTLCYYLKNKKRWQLLKTICRTGFFWTKFWTTLLAAFTWQPRLIELVELLQLYKLIITTEFPFPVR